MAWKVIVTPLDRREQFTETYEGDDAEAVAAQFVAAGGVPRYYSRGEMDFYPLAGIRKIEFERPDDEADTKDQA